jgi:hypothetical protein
MPKHTTEESDINTLAVELRAPSCLKNHIKSNNEYFSEILHAK